MIEALVALLNEKDFVSISVKELCVVADVNRTTFYSHYDNTFELLVDAKEKMIKDFLSTYGDSSLSDITAGKTGTMLLSKKYLIPYLEFIKKNKVIYNAFAKNSISLETDGYFENIVRYIAIPLAKKRGSDDQVAINYVTHFYIEGINSIVREWIKRDFKESEETIASIIEGVLPKE